MPSSSTSNSEIAFERSSLRRWTFYLVCLSAAAWVPFVVAFLSSNWIEAQFGDAIMRATKLRTYQPSEFVCHRLFDMAVVATSGCIALWFVLQMCFLLQGISRLGRLVLLSSLGFVCVNLVCFIAMQHASFWLTLLTLGPDYRLPSATAERLMLDESQSDLTGILIGSSQGPAQIGVGYLNRDLGPKIQFANNCYIGSQGIDFLMLQNYLDPYPDVIVCYLSEICFSRGVDDSHVLTLWTKKTDRDVKQLGGEEYVSSLAKRYGQISRFVPLFRCRRGIEQALVADTGTPTVSNLVRTKEEESALWKKLDQDFIDFFRDDASTQFQYSTFDLVLERWHAAGSRVVLISGGISNEMALRVDPDLKYRTDMQQFLDRMAKKYKNITVLTEGKELPVPSRDQFRDYLHLSDEFRPWYTRQVAEQLADKLNLSIRNDPAPEAIK